MSQTLWGTPLIAGTVFDDLVAKKRLSDLRNWEQIYTDPINIHYDPVSRTNSYSLTAVHAHEALVYELPVEPNTNYMFDCRIYGKFTENNNNYDRAAVVVFAQKPENKSMRDQADIILTKRYISSDIRKNYIQRFDSGDLTSVFLAIHMAGCTDDEVAKFVIDNVMCIPALYLGDPIWAQKPRWINGYDDVDTINMMAVSSEGAWVYSCIDRAHTHHLYFLAGNEFKVLVFSTDSEIGFLGKNEFYSVPIVIKGRTYYACHEYWPDVDFIDIWTTEYVEDEPSDDTITKRLSDDEIYLKLSHWVREEEPYDIGDLYSKEMLQSYLQMDEGAIDEMFKDYTVDEYGLNYLSDPV